MGLRLTIGRWTLRPQNRCEGCGYTWYPRGKDLSARCPDCGSTRTALVRVNLAVLLGCLLGIGIPFLLCLGLLHEGQGSRQPKPAPIATPDKTRPGDEPKPADPGDVTDKPAVTPPAGEGSVVKSSPTAPASSDQKLPLPREEPPPHPHIYAPGCLARPTRFQVSHSHQGGS
jgi:hypothetical protein